MIDCNRVSLLNIHKRLGWIQPNNNLVPSDRATNIMCWSGVVSISSNWNSYWISWAFLFKPQVDPLHLIFARTKFQKTIYLSLETHLFN